VGLSNGVKVEAEVKTKKTLVLHLTLDRHVPRKPRLVGGAKGHNIKGNYLTGKGYPVGGELHFEISRHTISEKFIRKRRHT
jgi:hypothetical protein